MYFNGLKKSILGRVDIDSPVAFAHASQSATFDIIFDVLNDFDKALLEKHCENKNFVVRFSFFFLKVFELQSCTQNVLNSFFDLCK